MLVRYLTGDDPVETPRAEAVLRDDFLLSPTVLVETEWVLRSRYRFTREQRVAALRMALDLPAAVEVPPLARWAIGRMEAGADFADMMHLAGSGGAIRFATFDRDLARQAGPTPPLPIETIR